ncbi:pilus assembly PilX family protein [Desulfoluna spongiiphila]|uniref:Type 4 fimbrial biogenesis protein PilX N-terminal domain-containing protein n=1 Tax=Desulfoluna spongiiphila TaxID=419481 RepID=A0A1G5AKM7_9BACT|nr:PilX N-terminal domain-containing pilus assembly protein [Desulfoluna spongiiphila]SCX78404.1 hypothetical protein SAMN05216233_101259 [Desulfoluna spongiiphila]
MSKHLTDDTGAVMLFTLLFILIITVMGLIATQTSVFEIKITENSRRYNEEFARAEAALNDAIANFRNMPPFSETTQTTFGGGEATSETRTYVIEKVLNDTRYADYRTAFYKHGSYPVSSPSAAIEIRRIEKKTAPVPGLSTQANNVPKTLPHRYYAGSIDKRRFAVTATALKRNSTTFSTIWVQKGISLPAEQDKDLF